MQTVKKNTEGTSSPPFNDLFFTATRIWIFPQGIFYVA